VVSEVVEGGHAFPEQVAGAADAEGDSGGRDFGEGLESDGNYCAEGRGAAAFEGPEEVGVSAIVGGDDLASSGDDFEGEGVVCSCRDVNMYSGPSMGLGDS
jgi:hypothetical protein